MVVLILRYFVCLILGPGKPGKRPLSSRVNWQAGWWQTTSELTGLSWQANWQAGWRQTTSELAGQLAGRLAANDLRAGRPAQNKIY